MMKHFIQKIGPKNAALLTVGGIFATGFAMGMRNTEIKKKQGPDYQPNQQTNDNLEAQEKNHVKPFNPSPNK